MDMMQHLQMFSPLINRVFLNQTTSWLCCQTRKLFRLGQPLDAGRNINYIHGIDVSALSSDVPVPLPEFADFTTDESSDEDDEDGLA
jgi:hypothetical protein